MPRQPEITKGFTRIVQKLNALKSLIDGLGGGSGGSGGSYFRSENTDITTDLNASTAQFTTVVPLVGNATHTNGDFTVSGNGVVCNFNGDIRVVANVKMTVAGARVNVNIRTRIAGTPTGSIGASGYIRNSSGHNESSVHLNDIFAVTNGQLVEIGSRREAGATATPMDPVGGSNLIIERLS